MKVHLVEPLLDYEGKPLNINEDKQFNWRDAFMQLLTQFTPAEQSAGQGSETKAKIFALGVKLWQGKDADLTVDEAAFLKERAGHLSAPLVYGRICELLDGQPAAK